MNEATHRVDRRKEYDQLFSKADFAAAEDHRNREDFVRLKLSSYSENMQSKINTTVHTPEATEMPSPTSFCQEPSNTTAVLPSNNDISGPAAAAAQLHRSSEISVIVEQMGS